MTGSRADARPARRRIRTAAVPALLAGALLIAGAAAFPAPSLAQKGPPVRLTPAPAPAADEPAAPPASAGPTTATPAQPYIPGQGPKIDVSQPPPVTADSVGLKEPAQVGLPDTLWKNSSRAVVEQVIGALPNGTTSQPARELAKRLLVVAAPAPPGDGAVKGGSFVGARAAKLFAMGDIEDASALARLVPSRSEDEAAARLQLDSALAAYDNAGACNTVRGQIARFNGLYWQRALVFCQVLANEHDRAQLGLSIMHEQQAPEDAAFDRLVAKLSGDARATVDKLPAPTPLHLAMMRAANLPLPAEVAQTSDPVVLRMVATSPNASPELRLAAAERAEALGGISADTLAQMYEGIAFGAEQLADPLSVAQSDKGPRGRAVLHRAAKQMTIGPDRAELLQKSWRLARERGLYPTVVRADLPLLLELPPGQDYMFFAPEAARALLIAGKFDEAQRWFQEVRTAAASGSELAGTAEALLSPLFWLADPEQRKANTPPLSTRVDAWRKAQEKLDAASLPRRSALLVTLLTSTGDQPDAALLAPLLAANEKREPAQMPSMALWLGLGAAFEAGRIGETALFSLAVLGPDGAAGAAPQTVALALDALRAASLDPDARALAVEAAVLGGL